MGDGQSDFFLPEYESNMAGVDQTVKRQNKRILVKVEITKQEKEEEKTKMACEKSSCLTVKMMA